MRNNGIVFFYPLCFRSLPQRVRTTHIAHRHSPLGLSAWVLLIFNSQLTRQPTMQLTWTAVWTFIITFYSSKCSVLFDVVTYIYAFFVVVVNVEINLIRVIFCRFEIGVCSTPLYKSSTYTRTAHLPFSRHRRTTLPPVMISSINISIHELQRPSEVKKQNSNSYRTHEQHHVEQMTFFRLIGRPCALHCDWSSLISTEFIT